MVFIFFNKVLYSVKNGPFKCMKMRVYSIGAKANFSIKTALTVSKTRFGPVFAI